MFEIGMTEVGYGQFGIVGLMSGLYIEMVWNYSDEDFKSYIDWVKSLILKKLTTKEVFKIAEFDTQGNLRLKRQEFETYPDAMKGIELLPAGTYQIQKVFVKS
jgi:hypothetical protein